MRKLLETLIYIYKNFNNSIIKNNYFIYELTLILRSYSRSNLNGSEQEKVSKATEIRYHWIHQRILAEEFDTGASNTSTVPGAPNTSIVTYPRFVATVRPELQVPLL